MALGTSSLLTQLSIVVITVVNNLLLVRYGAASVYGADIPLAAFVVIMKLFQIVLNIAIGIVAGAQPIVGYNYGAGKYDRVRQLLKQIVGWTVAVCLICTLLFGAVPQVFIRMFGADGELYTQFAVGCLRIYLSLIVFTCVQKVCAIFLQSIGHAKTAALLSVLRDVLLIVLSLIAPAFLGVTGIFWAAPAADVIAIAVTAGVMVRLWKQLKVEVSQEDKVSESLLPGYPTKAGVVVTISREHGSAGKCIGQSLAKMLGIPCYDKEMIAIAAHESGLAKEFLSNLNSDEHAVMRDLYLSTNVIQEAITAQDKAIQKIADAGSCVIVGRSADYVLRNYPNIVRVFITAPKSYRVKKVMEMYGDSKEQAQKSIERSDRARKAYDESITGKRWGDSHSYELCIDSSAGIEETANLIFSYVQMAVR